MKKIAICLMITCLSLILLPLQSTASTITAASDSLTVSKPAELSEGKSVEFRKDGTNSMNKSKSGTADKKNLQQVEIVSGRHHHHHGVVFITGGGLLLIIVLVIILL
jgi:hypothetical protein